MIIKTLKNKPFIKYHDCCVLLPGLSIEDVLYKHKYK